MQTIIFNSDCYLKIIRIVSPLNRSESVLYGTWKVLKFIEDLRPDLKKNPIDRGFKSIR